MVCVLTIRTMESVAQASCGAPSLKAKLDSNLSKQKRVRVKTDDSGSSLHDSVK